MLETEKTGLLVFTESANQLVKRKKLASNRFCNQLLHKLLLRKTKALVEATSSDYIWWDESRQEGNTFHERLYHAIAAQFESGFDRLIVIGSDHPNLTQTHIRKALSILHSGKSVLGPAADGGCYLFSIEKSDFQDFCAAAISWQEKSVQEEILDFFAVRRKKCVQLNILEDLDDENDLAYLIGKLGHTSILRRLKSIFNLPLRSPKILRYTELSIPIYSIAGRAPPLW